MYNVVMSFTLSALQDSPVGLFQMDDTAPFQDYSSYDRVGTTVSGTPGTSVSLTAGAVFSTVFDKNVVGKFACPIFKQGYEDDSFSIGAWVYPVAKTTGQTAQTYRENLFPNPSAEINTSGFTGASGSPTITSDTGTATGWPSAGTKSFKIVSGTTGGVCGARQGYNYRAAAAPGDVFSASAMFRNGNAAAKDFVLYIRFYDIAPTDTNAGNTLATTVVTVNIGANGIAQIKNQNVVAPAGTLSVGLLFVENSTTTGDIFYVDSIMLNKGSTVFPYIDGSMPGYEWAGTAHLSVSRTKTNVSRVNLTNPIVNNSAGIRPLDATNSTLVTGVSFLGASNWMRMTWNGTGNKILRQMANVGVLASNEPYTVTATLGNDGASPITINVDWCDQSVTPFIVQPGAQRTVSVTGTRQYDSTYRFADFEISAAGNFLIKDIIFEQGSISKPFFDGSYPGATWQGTANASESLLLLSNSDQQILSHSGQYDGLTINGTVVSFTTKFADGTEARASYDLQRIQNFHAVGVHTLSKNSLFINGVVVDEVDISETQQLSTFTATSPDLYTGLTTSSAAVAVNGISMFSKALDNESIMRMYQFGRSVPSGASVVENYGGDIIPLSMGHADPYVEEVYDTDEDWQTGVMTDVSVSENRLVPQFEDNTSVEGFWYASLPLDASGDTTIYGVTLNYVSQGAVVETSIDGTTWAAATPGGKIASIPAGFDPLDELLEIRIHFPGGVVDDPAYVESLTVALIPTGTTAPASGRTVTYTNAAPRGDYAPTELNDDWGVDIPAGGSVVIGADTLEASPARTIGVWIKRVGDNPTLSATGTTYQNGVAGTTTLDPGEWTLLHVAAAADITGSITINGPAKVGFVEIYDTELTAGDISNIYAAYSGTNQVKVTDTSTIAVSEPATASSIYAADWSITAAG